MSYELAFTQKALDGIERLKKSGNTPLLKKLKVLLFELCDHPFIGTGQPEQLKHDLTGLWSRRLNREHRIVYSVDQRIVTVTVISVIGHYK
ncbi:Txe/YoeB family addiction module toxin [Algoriphagus sp. A40]|uniref:Txe/YoeB family addiction module toxin n=1 Tax=Algoriphagus sp. A40 TaxID=1945863 RepID=UPI000984E3F1|nr:Txe/YoeB family addiction module toxin [Algoriphagus sp. A40]OOG69392.1 addiction module toxin YoeB [Algoriphagus sp. A40]